MDINQNIWKKCSSCKKPIGLDSIYYECSVSTCTGDRTGYVFCSIACFEVHLPGAKHRSAGAIEKRSPLKVVPVEAAKRIIIQTSQIPNGITPNQHTAKSTMEHEVLVVVSKMKQYIKDVSEMNTSEDVNHVISSMIRSQLDRAIENARREGRKTVMARDFK
jgi:histone H3/H4